MEKEKGGIAQELYEVMHEFISNHLGESKKIATQDLEGIINACTLTICNMIASSIPEEKEKKERDDIFLETSHMIQKNIVGNLRSIEDMWSSKGETIQ